MANPDGRNPQRQANSRKRVANRAAKAGPKRPIGGGGTGNPNSLANLRNAPAAPTGNARAVRHGGYAALPLTQLQGEAREIYEWLAAAAPLRDEIGELPAADEAAVEVAARALKRWRAVWMWCESFGRLDEKTGAEKPAARYELACEASLNRALTVLGLTPEARLKMGVDLVRGVPDLATAMSHRDPAERDRLMRQAGLIEEEAE